MLDERRSTTTTAAFPAVTGGPAVDPSARGVIAGRYRLLDRIGSGAMADVYRAHDETLDRDVAVKVFRSGMDGGDTAGDARRELELQALARLSHPNLITLFDGSVTDDDPAFLALELVEGPTLADLLRDGALPEQQVRRIGEQIADALAYVHERGMVHRDVKPANILLGRDTATDPTAFRARLSDFGIVRLVDSAQVTAADLTVGTAYYLAPEQARSAAVGPPADIYALGLLLLESLTGVRPFEGPMHEVLAARLARDPEIPTGLPQRWPGLLRAMTAQDPAARPTAAEVARTLRESAATGAGLPLAAGAAGGAAAAAAFADPSAAGAGTPPPAAPDDATVAALPLAAAAAPADASATPPAAGADGAVDAPGGHHFPGLLVAAAAFLLIIGGAGWFMFRPTAGSAGPGQGQVPPANAPASNSSAQSPSASPVAHTHHHAVPVNHTVPAGSGATAGRQSYAAAPKRHQSQSSSAPAPSHSVAGAPSTSAAPTSPSAPAPSSSPSSAPSSGPAPSSSPTPTPTSSGSSSAPAPSSSSSPSSAPSASGSNAPSLAASSPGGSPAASTTGTATA